MPTQDTSTTTSSSTGTPPPTDGPDSITGDAGDNTLIGGLGNDTLNGLEGYDAARYDDLPIGVQVNLSEGGNSFATRSTGFQLGVNQSFLNSLDANLPDASDVVAKAQAGELYVNVHTKSVPDGEVRAQLAATSTLNDVQTGEQTVVLSGTFAAEGASTSKATGTALVTLNVAADLTVRYDAAIFVNGIPVTELLPVGRFSAIHLHSGAQGQGGPVVTDLVQDAGGDVNGDDGAGGNVLSGAPELDQLISIEGSIGSTSDDTFTSDVPGGRFSGLAGNDLFNVGAKQTKAEGGAGTDTFVASEGTFTIDGGEDSDTIDFRNFSSGIFLDLNFEIHSTPNSTSQKGGLLSAGPRAGARHCPRSRSTILRPSSGRTSAMDSLATTRRTPSRGGSGTTRSTALRVPTSWMAEMTPIPRCFPGSRLGCAWI